MKTIAQLGPIVQLAYVPEDIDAAAKHWTRRVGAGPFFVLPNLTFSKTTYRGQAVDVTITAMLGYWGDMQIELIRQESVSPSIYTEWRAAGRHGLHHMALDVADQSVARASIAENGLTIVQESIVASGMEVLYVGSSEPDSTFIELLCTSERQRTFFAFMREAHRTWDGRDPMRSVP